MLGNRKFSSWSLRGWLAVASAGVPCETRVVRLFRPETPAEIARYSPAGRVPVLIDGAVRVHDSLAIAEYVNETYAGGALLPAEPRARALARAVCAEMHGGFPHLRERLPMNLGRPPAPPAPEWAIDPPTRAEIDRILGMWEGLLEDSGGPWLFGAWSLADCMYLPVATRLRTYCVPLEGHPRSRDYLERVLAVPAFREWEAAARAEPEEHPPYDR